MPPRSLHNSLWRCAEARRSLHSTVVAFLAWRSPHPSPWRYALGVFPLVCIPRCAFHHLPCNRPLARWHRGISPKAPGCRLCGHDMRCRCTCLCCVPFRVLAMAAGLGCTHSTATPSRFAMGMQWPPSPPLYPPWHNDRIAPGNGDVPWAYSPWYDSFGVRSIVSPAIDRLPDGAGEFSPNLPAAARVAMARNDAALAFAACPSVSPT